MKINTKTNSRIIGVLSMCMVIALSLSCKKEKSEPSPVVPVDNTSLNLVASANVNFISDNETKAFKCYKDFNSLGEAVIVYDSTLNLRFVNSTTNGAYDGGPTITVEIKNPNGFQAGDVYSVTNNPNNYKMSMSISKSDEDYILYRFGNDFPGEIGTIGELKITSITENKIKGEYLCKTIR